MHETYSVAVQRGHMSVRERYSFFMPPARLHSRSLCCVQNAGVKTVVKEGVNADEKTGEEIFT